MTNEEWKPKILGIVCNWCSYAGADLAGTARIQYPSDIRIVRTMCTGRVDLLLIMRAFMDGADGVIVSGCHFGDCHYLEGNYKAAKRMFYLKRVLKSLGLDDRRVRMTFVSASEGAKWAEVVKEMINTINELGPSPLNKGTKPAEIGQSASVVEDDLAEIAKVSAGKKLEVAPVIKN
ncbi:hydrogenase iron-sulfur subunit [Methanocella sp. CWC-04]|uniref:Hydrogenase iron-sulfur subunit n=1 Tax=Methanooceanicella nereidis TaxID=2052831 RepID=A0AAP2RFD9_9EURY|nr:hydrogenase iron-sulfur subunit [Methanocella sp. CWC-04]MCD1296379.1 hydrogenase iron-sulfur subunit [Methanocella sp. CWC-04]